MPRFVDFTDADGTHGLGRILGLLIFWKSIVAAQGKNKDIKREILKNSKFNMI